LFSQKEWQKYQKKLAVCAYNTTANFERA